MKSKLLLTFFTLTVCLNEMASQNKIRQNCKLAAEFIQDGKLLVSSGRFVEAIEYFNSAENCCSDSSSAVSKLIVDLIKKQDEQSKINFALLKGLQLTSNASIQEDLNSTYSAHALEAAIKIYPQNTANQKILTKIYSDTTLAFYNKKMFHFPEIVHGVAISSDKKKIITGGQNNFVYLWEEGVKRKLLEIPDGYNLFDLDMSSDGRYVVIICTAFLSDGIVYLLDTQQPGFSPQVFKQPHSMIYSTEISQNGQYFITGSHDGAENSGVVRLYKYGQQEVIREFRYGMPVGGLTTAISSDSKWILAANGNDYAVIWDFGGGIIKKIPGRFTAVSMDDTANTLLLGGADGSVEVWKRTSCDTCYTQIQKIDAAHAEKVFSSAMSSDGRYFVTGSLDNTAKLWEVANPRPLQIFLGDGSDVHSVDITPDCKYIVTGCMNGNAYLWENRRLPILQTLPANKNDVNNIAMSFDAEIIATVEADTIVRIWRKDSGECIKAIVSKFGRISDLAVSQKGQQLMLLCSDSVLVFYPDWGVETMQVIHGKSVQFQSYSFLDKNFTILNKDGSVQVFEKDGFKIVDSLGIGKGEEILAMSENGMFQIVQNKKEEKLYLIEHGKRRDIHWPEFGKISTCAISENGIYYALGFQDGLVQLWSKNKKNPISTGSKHDRHIISLAITPNGKYFVSASQDGKAMLWQNGYDEPLQIYEGHGYAAIKALITPDGQKVLTLGGNNSVRLWATPDLMLDSLIHPLSLDEKLTLQIPVEIHEILSSKNLRTQWLGINSFESLFKLTYDESLLDSMKFIIDSIFTSKFFENLPYKQFRDWLTKTQNKMDVNEDTPELVSIFSKIKEKLKLNPVNVEWVKQRSLGELISMQLEDPNPIVKLKLDEMFKDTSSLNKNISIKGFFVLESYSDTLKNVYLKQYLLSRFSDTSLLKNLNIYGLFKFRTKYKNKKFDNYLETKMQDSIYLTAIDLKDLLEVKSKYDFSMYPMLDEVLKQKRMEKHLENVNSLKKELAELEGNINNKQEGNDAIQTIAQKYSSLAWELLLLNNAVEAEKMIRKGLQYNQNNEYLISNLPHAHLFQGKSEATSEYLELANKKMNDLRYKTYRKAFLDDFKKFKEEGLEVKGMLEVKEMLEKE